MATIFLHDSADLDKEHDDDSYDDVGQGHIGHECHVRGEM